MFGVSGYHVAGGLRVEGCKDLFRGRCSTLYFFERNRPREKKHAMRLIFVSDRVIVRGSQWSALQNQNR